MTKKEAVKLWLYLQHLSQARGCEKLSPLTLESFLDSVGAIQLDSVNVLDRAHYLTLWSRFDVYDKTDLDKWIYQDKVAYEYWGHEASLLPYSQLLHSKRRMNNFPPESWKNSAWWSRYKTSEKSKKSVLQRLKKEGPLESRNFERTDNHQRAKGLKNYSETLFNSKEDKRSLHLLWHAGKAAIDQRIHFRRHYNLADSVYPRCRMSSIKNFEESWLENGLNGNGVVCFSHLNNYFTTPILSAARKREIIKRYIKDKKIIEVNIDGLEESFFVKPSHLELIKNLPEPRGTTIICPFDSLLWQRKRAVDLLDYCYKIEIYVPVKKRIYGYYMMPILHNGKLIGRIDPKLHRDCGELEIISKYLENGFKRTKTFDKAFERALISLSKFVGADNIKDLTEWNNKNTK